MTLPFTAPWLLAPMEGVTDPRFRDLVICHNDATSLGGAFTEFLRIAHYPMREETIARHLGDKRYAVPVGLQLMGSDLDCLAETARRACDLGVPLIDLNFGCPARGARKGCAGAALLDDLPLLENVVRSVVEAVGPLPVTAKVRAGSTDAEHVEDIARAAENGGASLLTIHCRTRSEGYCEEVAWDRIARAVSAVSIPVCGNGGIASHADLERMRAETGCRYVMVGHAALGNPWVFSGRSVSEGEAAAFLREYGDTMVAEGCTRRGATGRLKQLIRRWEAGNLFTPQERQGFLEIRDADEFFAELHRLAAGSATR